MCAKKLHNKIKLLIFVLSKLLTYKLSNMKKKYSYQSQVAKAANELFHSGKVKNLSEAFKMAHKAVKLRNHLKTNIIEFSFTKADGSTRKAVGTLNSEYFDYQSKGTPKRDNPVVIKYFDIERGGFRSFRVERLTA